jgi:hypothetical protein
LTYNTRLRSLYITGISFDHHTDRTCGNILDMFSRIPSLGLSHVTLKFIGIADNTELVWQQLGVALSRPQFASLQKVQINIDYDNPPEFDSLSGVEMAWTDMVHKGMPDLHNRGILDASVLTLD